MRHEVGTVSPSGLTRRGEGLDVTYQRELIDESAIRYTMLADGEWLQSKPPAG